MNEVKNFKKRDNFHLKIITFAACLQVNISQAEESLRVLFELSAQDAINSIQRLDLHECLFGAKINIRDYSDICEGYMSVQ